MSDEHFSEPAAAIATKANLGSPSGWVAAAILAVAFACAVEADVDIGTRVNEAVDES
jgi:hypothetical protein